jgi:hypothetical protein
MPSPVVQTVRPALAVLLLGAAAACGSPTAPAERVVTLEVGPVRVPCVGEGPRECLQVRERADAAWQLFYDPIVGFEHETGYRYVLRVGRRAVANPPADGSSVAYRLLAVLSKTAAP